MKNNLDHSDRACLFKICFLIIDLYKSHWITKTLHNQKVIWLVSAPPYEFGPGVGHMNTAPESSDASPGLRAWANKLKLWKLNDFMIFMMLCYVGVFLPKTMENLFSTWLCVSNDTEQLGSHQTNSLQLGESTLNSFEYVSKMATYRTIQSLIAAVVCKFKTRLSM